MEQGTHNPLVVGSNPAGPTIYSVNNVVVYGVLFMLKKWEELPADMRCSEVQEYYEILSKKRGSIFAKRLFDIVMGLVVLILLCIPMLVIALLVKLDSPGPVFYRQERVTSYGKHFRIHKFRTMVANADKIGTAVTTDGDTRITRVGAKLRDFRLDEFPQVFDVLAGNMSFVGTRPEAARYVLSYTNEMKATLLLPAGITSEASIRYKDEAQLLDAAADVDAAYLSQVLPQKMKYNLDSIRNFSFWSDIATMFRTIAAVAGKEYR